MPTLFCVVKKARATDVKGAATRRGPIKKGAVITQEKTAGALHADGGGYTLSAGREAETPD
jgi:hypothetical protein